MLNLGCGSIYHHEWQNVDLIPHSEQVEKCDILNMLPYVNDSFDVVYSSHVLEHLKPDKVDSVLAEMTRVLKPSGTLRLVVPDLEGVTRAYLNSLESVRAKRDRINEQNYDWMMLELYDQVVRTERGGGMLRFLERSELYNKAFILNRIGKEAEPILAKVEHFQNVLADVQANSAGRPIIVFGAGSIGIKLIRWLQDQGVEVSFIVDNNIDKWGQLVEGIPVVSPDTHHSSSYILIASSWWHEIEGQLKGYGLLDKKDYSVLYVPPLSVNPTTHVNSNNEMEREKRIDEIAQMIRSLLGRDEEQAFHESLFKLRGEVHQWMYDSFSLGRLMERFGMVDIRVCTATESRIPGFVSYNLDTSGQEARKPDSLYMECSKR